MTPSIDDTLRVLRARFKPAAVAKKTTYYLSLGDASDRKWTVTLTPTSCEMVPGKIDNADCVLKMAAPLFMKLISGTYKPGPMDFVTGKIKTSDLGLLMQLQQAFGL
jgi:long-chain acyl-CoA synthetase